MKLVNSSPMPNFTNTSFLLLFVCMFVVPFLNQRTLLHVAASNGRDYTVEWLVEKGADINIKDKTGVCETVFLMLVNSLLLNCD